MEGEKSSTFSFCLPFHSSAASVTAVHSEREKGEKENKEQLKESCEMEDVFEIVQMLEITFFHDSFTIPSPASSFFVLLALPVPAPQPPAGQGQAGHSESQHRAPAACFLGAGKGLQGSQQQAGPSSRCDH